jgi:soluble lytic murein transglycosylase-like protein
MKTYTVQPGDTLFLIAKKFYGDGYKYTLLANYNNMDDSNALEVGNIINIPSEQELLTAADRLSNWHNYGNGTIYWRVTARGVEVKGKGLIKKEKYTQQAARIWQAYQQPILAASQKHEVPVPAIIATISTESSGNPKAYRYEPDFYDNYLKDKESWIQNPFYDDPKRISASYGLMQIMYTTAYNVGFREEPEKLYDPATNIDVSAAYIASPAQKKQHHWDPPKIACAYNAGSVRPTKKNEWGMFYHPGHLDRWIPAYNGAIEVIGDEYAPEAPTVEPEEVAAPQPQPASPSAPLEVSEKLESTLRIVFPQTGGKPWKTLIVDMFKHLESGTNELISHVISSPTTEPNTGYVYDVCKLEPGIYDLVFAEVGSGSVVYDVADYDITAQHVTLDLRQSLRSVSEPSTSRQVTVILRFPQDVGQVWKPLIVDVSKHEDGQIGVPTSYMIKIPSHGPEGSYIYEIPDIKSGTYNLVLKDAVSNTVIQEIAGYVVDDDPEIIDLRRNRAMYRPQEILPEKGIGEVLKRVFHKFISFFSGQ